VEPALLVELHAPPLYSSKKVGKNETMIHSAMRAFRRPLALAVLSIGLGTLARPPHPAWVGFGFPVFVGPPVCYPPPAGPVDHTVASGAGCYCTTTLGRLGGRAT
jgi:hypothetical protein